MSYNKGIREIIPVALIMLISLLSLTRCVKNPTLPLLSTEEAVEITVGSAQTGGIITDDGGAAITARGVCWSRESGPDITNDIIPSGTGAGSFTVTIEGLEPNTEYHVRAYAENSIGLAYGDEVIFTTLIASPAVITGQISDVTANSAVCQGEITYDGGAPVTEKGICWSISPAPDLEDQHIVSSSGGLTYSCTLTGLQSGTRYFARAYVKNGSNIAYGEEVTFLTGVTDIEGNLYKTVMIGTQVWMAENLKTTRFNDNSPIPNVEESADWIIQSEPAYCWLRNQIAYKDVYGALYNWYAAATGTLCPTGWHVPSDNEFKTMEKFLGISEAQLNLYDEWRGTDQGIQLKSTTGWAAGENGTNSSGFSALPGGYRFGKDGAFNGINMNTYWWSSTPSSDIYGWYRFLTGTNDNVFRYYTSQQGGKYIRCVKD